LHHLFKMRFLKIYLIVLISLPKLLTAQYYDKKYVKDLRYRLLISYFQEYRSTEWAIKPIKRLDSTGNEGLRLASSANLFSGLLIQTNNSSLYLAATTPQTEVDKQKFGEQTASVFKIAIAERAVYTSFSIIKNKGFYDKYYNQHPDFLKDTLSYRRQNTSQATWINFDISYYKNNRRFAIGMPTYFGLRQLKSNVSLGGRLSYTYLKLENNTNYFFRDSLTKYKKELGISKLHYQGINLSVAPSAHLVAMKKIFLSADLSLGLDIGNVKTKSELSNNSKVYANLSLSQAKFITGYHGDRFITAVYYTFINQGFKTSYLTAGSTYHTFGFIMGFRINVYKNLPWEKD
jgi:hypothetical protein